MPKEREKWLKGQLAFQQSHTYFTNAARTLRNQGKKNNIKRLQELLANE